MVFSCRMPNAYGSSTLRYHGSSGEGNIQVSPIHPLAWEDGRGVGRRECVGK